MKLIIEGRLPGLNDYTKACRGNKFAGASMKSDAEELIGSYIKSQLKGHIEGRYRVDFIWYEKDSRRDADNVAFGKKFILDALVRYGIVQGDSRQYFSKFTDEVLIDKDHPRIEVTIESQT